MKAFRLCGSKVVRQPVAVASAASLIAVGLVGGSVVSPAAAAGENSSTSQIFTYKGSTEQFTVPSGVKRLVVAGIGGKGGDGHQNEGGRSAAGGLGGAVSAAVSLTAGDTYDIKVGGSGSRGENAPGGWNGGGNSGSINHSDYYSGSGGGATTIEQAGEFLFVAPGGGGGGGNGRQTVGDSGGRGGELGRNDGKGDNGGNGDNPGAGGAGGAENGSTGGKGGDGDSAVFGNGGSGGGGGGGYKGGAGGKGGLSPFFGVASAGGGGGSGSAYVAPGSTFDTYATATSSVGQLKLEWREIQTKSVGDVVVGKPYSQQFSQTGKAGITVTWSIASGFLPAGLTFDATGLVSGTPTVQADASIPVVVRVADSEGAITEQRVVFEVHNAPPVITDHDVTDVTTTTATTHATVTTAGTALTGIKCQYSNNVDEDGNLVSPDEQVANPDNVISGETDAPVKCDLTDLDQDATYYYKFVGTYGSDSVDSGQVMSFNTHKEIQPAQISAGPATDVTLNSAKAHGSARAGASDLNNIQCLVSESADMSGATPFDATPPTVESTDISDVTCELTALSPATDYYVTLIGADGGASVDSGSPVKFTTLTPPTPILPPMVEVAQASDIGETTATGNGAVTTSGSSLSGIKCLYAREGENGFSQVDATPDQVESPANEAPVSCAFTGLNPDTKYFYRFIGLDDDEEYDASEVEEFTTKATPTPPVPPVPPKPVVKQKQTLRSGFAPKKIKARGVTVVNKGNATTRQGVALTAKVSKVRAKCAKVVKGKKRKLSLRTLGKCTFKVKVTYMAAGNSKYLPLKVTKTYKVKRR